jgi:hypothetical protein
LAQLRTQYNLGQSDLGEIDPASEAMKLATMGLRPVAVITLWEKANEYKMKEDWDNLSATLNQIIKLQPNFITVWEFQSHNLAYNVSVEFDDYRQRYHWVKRGISFLDRRNPLQPRKPASCCTRSAGSWARSSGERTSTSSSERCSAKTMISTAN